MPDLFPPRLEKLDLQPDVQKLLRGFTANAGVQTFLWTGPEGSGKKTYALALARSLFCKDGPDCPGCPACRQVLNRTHPDLYWVHKEHFWSEDNKEAAKGEITVKVMQELSEKLHRAPFSAPFKVAVVPQDWLMNDLAQNVFLKTLEEPPANTIIILLARKTGDYIPTVLSRCRAVRFPALSPAAVERELVRTHGWEKSKAREAAEGSEGNLTLALRFADPEWTGFRDKVCADFDRALGGPEEDWLGISDLYDKLEPDFLGDAERTATQRKTEVMGAAFRVYIACWTRRLTGGKTVPDKMRSLPPDAILRSLNKHQDMLASSNLNPRMLLDHLFMELREGFRKGRVDDRSFSELSVQI